MTSQIDDSHYAVAAYQILSGKRTGDINVVITHMGEPFSYQVAIRYKPGHSSLEGYFIKTSASATPGFRTVEILDGEEYTFKMTVRVRLHIEGLLSILSAPDDWHMIDNDEYKAMNGPFWTPTYVDDILCWVEPFEFTGDE